MNDFFPWDLAKYGLAIAEMDRQHEILVQVMNRIAARSADGAPKPELSRLLQQLLNYTVQHFEDEEGYMASQAYPKLDTHRRIHADLIAQLRGHIASFEARSSAQLDPALLGFLKFWLAAHIQGIDKQYAEHTRRRSA